jgi:hypothetical protein
MPLTDGLWRLEPICDLRQEAGCLMPSAGLRLFYFRALIQFAKGLNAPLYSHLNCTKYAARHVFVREPCLPDSLVMAFSVWPLPGGTPGLEPTG